MSSMAPRINGFSICLFRCKSKKTTKLCVTGLCERKPPVTGGFPSQRASNAEKGYIWWRHHGMILLSPSRLLVWTHGPLFTKTPSYCSGSAGASVVAHSVALPHIEIAFSTLDCSIVPTCGAWGSATAAQTWTLETVLGGNTALTRWWTARSIDADAKR